MEINFDNLKRLFEKVKSIGFLERLFNWSNVKDQLIDASADLQKVSSALESLKSENLKTENQLTVEKAATKNLQDAVNRLNTENELLKNSSSLQNERIESLQKEVTTLSTKNDQYLKRGNELSFEVNGLKIKVENAEKELRETRDENLRFRKDEEHRIQDHSKLISSLKDIQDKVQKDREKEIDDKNKIEIERIKNLKETWFNHEENVKARIKAICGKHGVDYLDTVPFKGKPDNTLKIKDEYIIFDAKSPAGDNLSNFPTYIKNQVESVMKYVKEEDVRREVFLVVPTNTLEHLDQFEYKLADYYVYVVSLDSLEPIIIALKKIEEYEFAEQLSPEERENICRVIGKFIHLSKRRIQIDGFFAKQFFELVYRSEAELPKDILDKVIEFEKSEKLNPPIEKRAKQISTKELESDADKLKTEATQQGIMTQDALLSKELNKLPLYSTEPEPEVSKDQGKLFS